MELVIDVYMFSLVAATILRYIFFGQSLRWFTEASGKRVDWGCAVVLYAADGCVRLKQRCRSCARVAYSIEWKHVTIEVPRWSID